MAYFDKYGVEFTDDRKSLVKCPKDFKGEYVIPKGVEEIAEWAFSDCYKLSMVTLSDGVRKIDDYAFFECCGLEAIILPDTISYIGDCAFKGCCGLEVINLPYGLREIGPFAFSECSILSAIAIPKSVEKIEDYAFSHCRNLRTVIILSDNISIDNSVFNGCLSLQEIIVPRGRKDNFSHMDNLSKWADKITEKGFNEYASPSVRSWDELEQLWLDMYHKYEKKETEYDEVVYNMLSQGLIPSAMPPIGVCLTTEEYALYKSERQDFKKIHAWCWSGRDMHETMRVYLNTPSMTKIGEPIVGLLTPRKGIYKVIRMDSSSLYCYYLGKDIRDEDNNYDFLEDIVEINPSPLFNYYSKGPKEYDIATGDIIIVTDNQLKKLHQSEGKTYSITWMFGNPKF